MTVPSRAFWALCQPPCMRAAELRSTTQLIWGTWHRQYRCPRACQLLRSLDHSRLCSSAGEANTISEASTSGWSVDEAGASKSWHRQDVRVVLVHPQIPQNTGTIARTCAAASVPLHLVRPLGFEIDSTRLKRAGLDYWPYVVVKVHDSWQAFLEYLDGQEGSKRLIAFTKFATQSYSAPGTYQPGDWLLFGAETTGLPPEAHEAAAAGGGRLVRIPMVERHVRSLNQAVSAGIGLYEALRQLDAQLDHSMPSTALPAHGAVAAPAPVQGVAAS